MIFLNTFLSKFFSFKIKDADDLPFKKGEILTVISKDEDQWWTAKNSLGYQGSIPVPYVQKVILIFKICPKKYENVFKTSFFLT